MTRDYTISKGIVVEISRSFTSADGRIRATTSQQIALAGRSPSLRQFYLTGYGLPEPQGVRLGPSPWVWVGLVGVVLVAVGLIATRWWKGQR